MEKSNWNILLYFSPSFFVATNMKNAKPCQRHELRIQVLLGIVA